MTNEWLTNHQQVEARSGVGRGDKVIFEEKKCTGESGDVDDIVKNVNIAMQIFWVIFIDFSLFKK